jgi:hypothetical protein
MVPWSLPDLPMNAGGHWLIGELCRYQNPQRHRRTGTPAGTNAGELRHLQVLQMKPSPMWKLDLLSQMERSAKEEIMLRPKGLALTKQR